MITASTIVSLYFANELTIRGIDNRKYKYNKQANFEQAAEYAAALYILRHKHNINLPSYKKEK